MLKARGILFFLFLAVGLALNGQYTKEFKRIFFDADYLMETGFYEEAFNRYKNLLTLDPGNYNILFHCGACCLNIPGNEEQAITYLKEAAEGVSLSYKKKTHKETGAPVLTYFMLGQAYHLNYQFSAALARYTEYLEMGTKEDQLQLDYARMQKEACERAASIEQTLPSFEFQGVLEHFEDDLPSCSNPVISGDGNILIFLVDYPSDKKIMMTTRTDSVWSRPRVINSEIGMVGETYPVSLSYDGRDLYMVHQFYSHSDIFVSHLEGKRWSEAEALGYQINGRTSENHASISRDGQSLYFTSDVRGGYGSFDIYVSHLTEKGEWGDPVNLGPTINTSFEEYTPFISNNDSILFFSSQGHATIGGADVFHSSLQSNGNWSEPENLGYPVNTTGDDLFFNPGWDEFESYYAVRREDDPTSSTINLALKLEYEEEELLAELIYAPELPVETETVVPVTTYVTQAETETAPSLPEEEGVVTEAQLIEPPNTDEIEMVLNERKPEVETASEPVVTPIETTFVTQASDPVETPAFTNELTTGIPFLTNKYELGPAAQLEVERVAELLVYHPESTVELTGYTDFTGEEDFNMILSHYRAEKIAEYLEMRGIDRERIKLEGKGESDPLAINSFSDGTDATLGRYLNRKVKVRILGKLPLDSKLSGLYIPVNLVPPEEMTPAAVARQYHYTIQLKATRMPILDSRFEDIVDVSEYYGTDGYYRYTTSSFHTFREARARLLILRKRGYPDAFIQTREWYEKAIKQ
jgi:outer membrane protein OmpA-like peptidoglycan-associated protein/tetratricopeptide (TPR) repeat protein